MATVYILYSEKIDHFYIGSCIDFIVRLTEHNTAKYAFSYTAKTNDWRLHFKIDHLEPIVARKIESHLKGMKSRNYLENLIKYPEISEKLVAKYAGSAR